MRKLKGASVHPDPSVRLQAVMAAGLVPSEQDLETLIAWCRVEPDFQVREMLTWTLLRLPRESVVPRLVDELKRPEAQARAQALHTLSKSGAVETWDVVAAQLDDEDSVVVRTSWYAAVALVPDNRREWLGRRLAERLGQGDGPTQLSLSRALVALGMDVAESALASVGHDTREAVLKHVAEVRRLINDPEGAFAPSLLTARREVAMGRTRSTKG
ncbi:MAG: HEAT repeat domain-containing protein [Phreatobacter oligotrophus]|jgi:HEAT repeat protein|nr:HEAT repeat domain-containing protein [Phreatobacter oligotrophus]